MLNLFKLVLDSMTVCATPIVLLFTISCTAVFCPGDSSSRYGSNVQAVLL